MDIFMNLDSVNHKIRNDIECILSGGSTNLEFSFEMEQHMEPRRDRKNGRKEYQGSGALNNTMHGHPHQHHQHQQMYHHKNGHPMPYYAVAMAPEDCGPDYGQPIPAYADSAYAQPGTHLNGARPVHMPMPAYPQFITSYGMPHTNGQAMPQDASGHFKMPFYGYPPFTGAPAIGQMPPPPITNGHQIEMQPMQGAQLVDMMGMMNGSPAGNKPPMQLNNENNEALSSAPNNVPPHPTMATFSVPAGFPGHHGQPAFLPTTYLPAQISPNAFPNTPHMIYFPVSLPPHFYHPAHGYAASMAPNQPMMASAPVTQTIPNQPLATPPPSPQHQQYLSHESSQDEQTEQSHDAGSFEEQPQSSSPMNSGNQPPQFVHHHQQPSPQQQYHNEPTQFTQLPPPPCEAVVHYSFLSPESCDEDSAVQMNGFADEEDSVQEQLQHMEASQSNNEDQNSPDEAQSSQYLSQSSSGLADSQNISDPLTVTNEPSVQSISTSNQSLSSSDPIVKQSVEQDEELPEESVSVLSVEEVEQTQTLNESTNQSSDLMLEIAPALSNLQINGSSEETEEPVVESIQDTVQSEVSVANDISTAFNEASKKAPTEPVAKEESVDKSISSTATTATNSDGGARSWADLFKSSQNKVPVVKPVFLNHSDPEDTATTLFSSRDFEPTLNSSAPSRQNKRSPVSSSSKSSVEVVGFDQDPVAPKLARRLKDYRSKHSLPFLIPRGFTNQGNYCYINSTLQALLYCPPFYNFMRELGEVTNLFRDRTCTPILDSFARFFTNFMPSELMMKRSRGGGQIAFDDLPKAEPFEPKCIYEVLGRINDECLKGKQEDAEEFLSSLLNGMNEEIIQLFQLLQPEKKMVNGNAHQVNGISSSTKSESTRSTLDEDNRNNSNEQLWKDFGSRHKVVVRSTKMINTPITDIFGGLLHTVRTAGKDQLHMRQPFFTLQLDIQSDRVRSIEDALRQLTLTESIQDYTCPKTNKNIEASCQILIDQLPPILILHAKLFTFDKNGGQKKLMKRLEFPIDLEVPRECLLQDRPRFAKSYKLLSVLYHEGSEANKGHFITDLYHIGTSLWLRCDDGVVKPISVQQLLHPTSLKTPYLLFYRRCDTLRMSGRA